MRLKQRSRAMAKRVLAHVPPFRGWLTDRDRLREACDRGVAERDRLAVECDRLVTAYDRLAEERSRLVTAYDHLAEERNRLVTAHDHLAEERNRLVTEYDRLAEQRDRLATEYDRLTQDIERRNAEQRRATTGTATEQAAIRDLLCCFTPVRAIGVDKTRLGHDSDGGYVMLDAFAGAVAALSFGVATECSWDTAIAARGIDVYQFDHTVDGPPIDNARFRFFKRRIDAMVSETTDSLGSALARVPPSQATHTIPKADTILKIDIEGSEWAVFDAATPRELARLSQIVCEFHDFTHLDDPTWRATALRVMTKLRTQFEVVHVHGNNYARLQIVANVAFPDVVEVTLANRALFCFEPTDEVFPTKLDSPNSADHPDLFLANLRFR